MSGIERIIYETQDGVKYRFDGNRILRSFTGLGMPPVKYVTQPSRRSSGDVLLDYAYQKRVVQFQLRVQGCTREGYWKLRDKMVRIMRPNRTPYGFRFSAGTLKIYRPGLPAVGLDVVVEQGPVFTARNTDEWDEAAVNETIRWIAHDPLFYALDETCVTFTYGGADDLYFPIVFPIFFGERGINNTVPGVCVGHVTANPVVVAVGPMDGFRVTNAVGKMIKYDYAIEDGETVTIDTRRDRLTATSTLHGDVSNGIDWSVTSLEEFGVYPDPEIPDGVNTFQCVTEGDANSNTRVSIVWRDKFVGI